MRIPKVYIASPFFNEDQIALVQAIEAELLIAGCKYYSPRKDGVLKDMTPAEREKAAAGIYKLNIDNIQWADWVLAVIDNFDPGTVFEIGYAAAKGKKIVTLSNKGHGLNVMLSQCVVAHASSAHGAVGVITGEVFTDVVIPTTET